MLIGGISTVNGDNIDDVFNEPIGQFSAIEENVLPIHLLVSVF
ncbi:D-lyxose/D-mannose family sugar isomerase [Nitratireductor basaltis]|uniref:D-lyxose ketol-isomerase n=1 Tax=Nitratireductor basaltis TaxID=472175 RepID=A0A084UET0_9HYPH|nr:hypothetical protein EL18_02514 [Nitratireductor basaltis]